MKKTNKQHKSLDKILFTENQIWVLYAGVTGNFARKIVEKTHKFHTSWQN
jgi:hypothetical protein